MTNYFSLISQILIVLTELFLLLTLNVGFNVFFFKDNRFFKKTYDSCSFLEGSETQNSVLKCRDQAVSVPANVGGLFRVLYNKVHLPPHNILPLVLIAFL